MLKIIKNKLGLSTVIATLLLVLLTIVLVGIVWGVVINLTEELPEQGCVDIFEKVKFNYEYTCYKESTNEMYLSISLEDINLSKAIISITYPSTSKSIEILSTESTIEGLSYYTEGTSVKLPDRNSGTTYVYDLAAVGYSGKPDSIRIVPVVGKEQCGVSDSLDEIEDCQGF